MLKNILVLLFTLTLVFAPASSFAQTINPSPLQQPQNQSMGNAQETQAPTQETTLYQKTIVVSPTTFELTANVGEVVSNKLKIRNAGTEPLAITMETADFTTVGEGGEVAIKNAEDELYSLAKWIIVSPKNFTLAPQEERVVDFNIIVPIGAEPGGHYATVMAAATGGSAAGTGLAIAQKTGALVLLSVAGEVKENLFIKEFSASRFNEYGPVPFKIRFENAGTVHIKPMGFISVTDMFDAKVIDIPFPAHNIFPGKTRLIDDVKLDKKWLFGKYTATLVGNYGISNTPFMALTTFWVIPWKIIGGAALALLIISLFLWKIRRRMWLALNILIRGK